jgi:hypothetical protein
MWLRDLDILQEKGYRYVTQTEVDLIRVNGGLLPTHNSKGWYSTLEVYGTGADAKSALQLPGAASDYVARIEFILTDVKNNIRMPFDSNDIINDLFEPVAKAFPALGSGGGTQFLVDGAGMPVTIHLF